ncbi:Plasmodium exported protein (PHIST), unknown function [Plasmodium yoelii]|uniref:Dentin phosphoryn, putative n=3 Tax=Plasmodium yoelii TaxID=5861 RepID=Q7RNN0_PLAYO|nr:Plasmodium exported protein (PHIST), unknown function [Plasmodium yoelii]EAA21153.1 dentin phosphoryn, putative [Plasmodium yoelii yoelii]WBY59347.1 hypothetical protein Py17XNL_001205181 [Plasmodium yoelii yoelii]CDU19488.1 Plasmodium exported protein, unknown function [Plasmodium yoelii]VTZ80123.1 Plasmodium exported protein (PHIST), unknown function [Plasmodium yoelii]|eukprot:XP_729588.1 Plasmodium exported protein (PHIST), unknown function [Plasmodium yoelii]
MDSGKLPIIILPSSGSSVSLIKKNVNDRKLKKGNRRAYRKNSFERFNLASTFYKIILAFGIIIVVFLDNDSVHSNSEFSRIAKEGRNLSEAVAQDEATNVGFTGTEVVDNDEKHETEQINEKHETEQNDEKNDEQNDEQNVEQNVETNDSDSTHAASSEDSSKSESSHTDLDVTKDKENEQTNDSNENGAQYFQESSLSSNQAEYTHDAKLTETTNYEHGYEQGDEHYYVESQYQQESYGQQISNNPDIQYGISVIPSDSVIRSFLHTSLTISPEDDELDNPYREKTQDDVNTIHFTEWVGYMKHAIQEVDQGHEQPSTSEVPRPEQPSTSEVPRPEQPSTSEIPRPEQPSTSEVPRPEQPSTSEIPRPEQPSTSEIPRPEQPSTSEIPRPEQEAEYATINTKLPMGSENHQTNQQSGQGASNYNYNLDIIDENEINMLFGDPKSYGGAKRKTNFGSHHTEKESMNMWNEPTDLFKNKKSSPPKSSNSNVRGNEEMSMGMWDGLRPSSISRTHGMNSRQGMRPDLYYPSSSRNQGMRPDQYPPSSSRQSMIPEQYPPSSSRQGMRHDLYSPSSSRQGMRPDQYPPPNSRQSMRPDQYPPSSSRQGMRPDQYPPSSSRNQGMSRNKLIGSLDSLEDYKPEDSMWSGLKSSYQPISRKPSVSNIPGMDAFQREGYSRNEHEMFDRFDSNSMSRDYSSQYPTPTSSKSRNPMNSYNYRDSSRSGSKLNSPTTSLRGNDPYRSDNESASTLSIEEDKPCFRCVNYQSTKENKSVSHQSKSNDDEDLAQQEQLIIQTINKEKPGTVAVRGSREVSDASFSPKKSTDVQIKEMDDHINSKISALDVNTTPEALYDIWTDFIIAETKKFMLTQEYVLQYSIYLQKRNKLNPELRTKAWWKVFYSLVNKFVKHEKEDVSEFKELLKSSTNVSFNFVEFIKNKKEAWRELQSEIKDTWMAALTYKMNKYSYQSD